MARAHRDLADVWTALDHSNPVRVRTVLEGLFADLTRVYGDVAALLGADWFDMLRDAPPSASSFRAVLARPVAVGQAAASARWAIDPLFSAIPDPAVAYKRLAGSLQRLVLQPGRETVWGAARTDPVARSFARVPSGTTTCQWCVMLASRGFAYNTAEAAGEGIRFHDNCDCVIVPGNDRSDLPEDYDLDYYVDLYTSGQGISPE